MDKQYPASFLKQELAAKIFEEHPAVLREPEPWILVDELASSTIKLKFYVWVDGSIHNMYKVKSSVLRQIKTAYLAEGISMPDDASPKQLKNSPPVCVPLNVKVMGHEIVYSSIWKTE